MTCSHFYVDLGSPRPKAYLTPLCCKGGKVWEILLHNLRLEVMRTWKPTRPLLPIVKDEGSTNVSIKSFHCKQLLEIPICEAELRQNHDLASILCLWDRSFLMRDRRFVKKGSRGRGHLRSNSWNPMLPKITTFKEEHQCGDGHCHIAVHGIWHCWRMLQVHSFRRDANDPERIGIHESHLQGDLICPKGCPSAADGQFGEDWRLSLLLCCWTKTGLRHVYLYIELFWEAWCLCVH